MPAAPAVTRWRWNNLRNAIFLHGLGDVAQAGYCESGASTTGGGCLNLNDLGTTNNASASACSLPRWSCSCASTCTCAQYRQVGVRLTSLGQICDVSNGETVYTAVYISYTLHSARMRKPAPPFILLSSYHPVDPHSQNNRMMGSRTPLPGRS